MIIHGMNTPALGMLAFARAIQAREPNSHVVLYDLWGHGLSSTPLVPHTQQIFHQQILQVLTYLKWPTAHFLGYSLGGATLVAFSIHHPWVIESAMLIAPAGLLRFKELDPKLQSFLLNSDSHEQEARELMLKWFEGGSLEVPESWHDRLSEPLVLAKALRQWELSEHKGYPYTVFSAFRDGGVYDRDDDFRMFAGCTFKNGAVLGGKDDVCSERQLRDLGFQAVDVIEADHDLVRTHVDGVADLVVHFWSQ
jgi:pimeloyl-ACP methyl ester carboxylesterase